MPRALATIPASAGKLPDAHLYGILFAGAVAAFCLQRIVGSGFGLTSDIVAVVGDATCGWSWLLVRALFQPRPTRRRAWPLMLVLTLVAAGAFLRFEGQAAGALPRIVENVEALVSSALLLLAAIEPLNGIHRHMPAAERRFRIVFACSYAAMLAVAVLWVDGAPAGSFAARAGASIRAACALLALAGMGLAIRYRSRNPLPDGTAGRPRMPTTATADERALGERLLALIADEAVYTRPDLRVADVARRLGTAEYKLTRCITGALGFPNFNRMANHFRIGEAKRRLADPGFDHLPVLTIALDCGFGSIGPFNRAFKAETGVAPLHFRKTCRGGRDSCRTA